MACPDLTTDVTDEEAHAILEPWFLVAQEVFVEGLQRLGFPTTPIAKVQFQIDTSVRDTPRHFAGCLTSGRTIYAAPEMVELTESVVGAVFLHEFGHAADFLYPARFRLREDRIEVVPAYRSEQDTPHGYEALLVRTAGNIYREWERRSSDVVEVTADKIAECVSGRQIGYRGPCLLQHLDTGRPRPRGLR